jgi:hypothetical protein
LRRDAGGRAGEYPALSDHRSVALAGTDITTRLLAEVVEPSSGRKWWSSTNRRRRCAQMNTIVQAKPDGYTLGGLWNAPLTMTRMRKQCHSRCRITSPSAC